MGQLPAASFPSLSNESFHRSVCRLPVIHRFCRLSVVNLLCHPSATYSAQLLFFPKCNSWIALPCLTISDRTQEAALL